MDLINKKDSGEDNKTMKNFLINGDNIETEYYNLSNFIFENGESINGLKVEYATIGTPKINENNNITNAILFLHGWSGDCCSVRHLGDVIGPKKPIDTNKFFIISATALGSLNSASPSTTKLGSDFPKYTIKDMANFQKTFLKEKFNIVHLKGVIGNSMGGFEALTLGTTYPDYMDFLISLVSTYKVAGHNFALFKIMNDIIEKDPGYNNGNYEESPQIATYMASKSMYNYGLSLEYYRSLSNEEIEGYIEELALEGLDNDANDVIFRSNACLNYDIENDLDKITAKTFIFAVNQDQFFPPELDSKPMANLIKNSQLLVIDSILGHLATHEINIIEKELESFLAEFK
ncbi:MAG: alpha/beta fold hydrolase [Methanobacteriaceae archaeon]